MAVSVKFDALSSISLLLIFKTLSLSALVQARDSGFRVELIHIDSPNSPFYNASETPHSRLSNALRRSITRLNYFNQSFWGRTAQSSVAAGDGDFLMRLSIGTPPVEMVAVVDTGSDLTWTQCEPCERCFRQEEPFFIPRNSSTYTNLTCQSSHCVSLREQSFCLSNTCQYTYSYGDLSITEGVLAMDTIRLGSSTGQPCSLPNTTFGCGTHNDGNFEGTGIVGLGRGPLSLISRMDHLINGKFAYCLAPYSSNHSSKMNFGGHPMNHSTSKVLSTPLMRGDIDTFYYLALEAITVAGKRLELNTTTNNTNTSNNSTSNSSIGNMIIDSGTTVTFLPNDLHSRLHAEVKAAITSPAIDKGFAEGFTLCYDSNDNFQPPSMTMHFVGADIELKPVNTFLRIMGDVVCLAFFPGGDFLPIYGNTQQINFLVEYDTRANKISFSPTDCTKY